MADSHRQNTIIVGCGRLGAELARSLAEKKHVVTIVDASEKSFERLGPNFVGRTVQGEAIDHDVLLRAGIRETHAFASVTSSDSVNIVTARVARDIFNVEHVIARIYNPHKAIIYEKLGLQTVATSAWGVQRFEQLLLHPGIRTVGTAGNGEVQLYEVTIPVEWAGRRLADLASPDQAIPIAVTRGGRACLPTADFVLKDQDILQISATAEGVAALRRQIKSNGDRSP